MKVELPWASDYDADDPVLSLAFRGIDPYANFRDLALNIRKKYGNDLLMWKRNLDEAPEYIEGQKYSNYEKGLMADALLRQDSRKELCRECKTPGSETGKYKLEPQFDEDTGEPILNDEGKQLHLKFNELECDRGHKWHQGEGKARGIDGNNPILFEEHLQSRKRREIYTSDGITPDPSIVSGLYNRSHPQGRKVNSEEQRKKHGASYYRVYFFPVIFYAIIHGWHITNLF